MVSFREYQELALARPEVTEQLHFQRPSFRYRNKIFATYWTKENLAMLFLPLAEQSVFCAYDNAVFFPVSGMWGKKGATLVDLKKVRKDMFKDALGCAYRNIYEKHAPKKRTK